MIKLLKKLIETLFTKKETIVISPEQTKNNELVEFLLETANMEGIDLLLLDANAKICVVNTYTNTFYDLMNNIHRKHTATILIAANLHSYFKNSPIPFSEGLRRIAKYAEKNKISQTLIHDLYEIIDTLKYLADITE